MVRARDDLYWRRVDDEVVILDMRTSRYLRLNRSGAQLWSLLVAGTPPSRLIDELAGRHGIDRAAAGRDVERLVAQLREAGLLDEGGGSNEGAPVAPAGPPRTSVAESGGQSSPR